MVHFIFNHLYMKEIIGIRVDGQDWTWVSQKETSKKKKNWTWVIEENVAWFSVMLK